MAYLIFSFFFLNKAVNLTSLNMRSQRVGHDWVTLLSLFTFTHWSRKCQLTPVFLPRESHGWGSLVGCRLWGRTSRARLKRQQQQQLQQTFKKGLKYFLFSFLRLIFFSFSVLPFSLLSYFFLPLLSPPFFASLTSL